MKYFLSCDWGTSNFRLRLIDVETNKVLDEITHGQGIANTHKAFLASNQSDSTKITFYKKVLFDAMEKFPSGSLAKDAPIIISGMASSSIGMMELPYRKLPFIFNAGNINTFKIEPDEMFSHPIILISGCRTDTDIMRGEETILLGCDVGEDDDAVYILPGTHSKHIFMSKGAVTTFNTYVTGELFDLLVQRSVLSNSVIMGVDKPSFQKGVEDSLSNNILNRIFSVRVKHILNQSAPVSNYQYLSGLIIGTELKELRNAFTTIKLVSEDPLLSLYELALHTIGEKQIELISANEAFVNGHVKMIQHFNSPLK
jgi:2-dehydro-3-deoxygalactonokinase